jgi:hypothetical protein
MMPEFTPVGTISAPVSVRNSRMRTQRSRLAASVAANGVLSPKYCQMSVAVVAGVWALMPGVTTPATFSLMKPTTRPPETERRSARFLIA